MRARRRSRRSHGTSADPAKADAVMKIVRDTMAQTHLKAVIVRVTVDGKEVVTEGRRRIDDGCARYDRTCTSATARWPSPMCRRCC